MFLVAVSPATKARTKTVTGKIGFVSLVSLLPLSVSAIVCWDRKEGIQYRAPTTTAHLISKSLLSGHTSSSVVDETDWKNKDKDDDDDKEKLH